MYTQLEFDFAEHKLTQMEFDFTNSIEVIIDSGELTFTYKDKYYKYDICKYSRQSRNTIGYKIPFIMNGKLVKTNSLKEFYILKYLIDKYGVDNIIYENKIDVSGIDPNRREIQPDFYIKSLNKYIEYHNNKTDGKYDLYMEVAKAKNLNIEWWTDYEYYENEVTSKVPRHVALSEGFEYNFDNDIYVVKSSEGYYTITKLIDLFNSLNIELPKCIKDNYIICK